MNYTGIRVNVKPNFVVGNLIGVISPRTETLKEGDDYVFQFKIVNYTSTDVLDYIGCVDESDTTHFLTESLSITGGILANTFKDEGITKNEYLCHVKFKIPKTSKYRFVICRRTNNSDKEGKAFDIREVACEKGSMLQDYKEHSDDITEYIKKYETYMEQTNNAISMLAKIENVNHSDSKIEETSAKIDVTADNIRMEVSTVVNDVNSAIESTKNNILSEVDTAIEDVNTRISNTDSSIRSQLQQSMNEITSSIDLTKADIISEVNSKIDIASDEILLDVNSKIQASQTHILSEVDKVETEILSEVESKIDVSTDGILLEVDSRMEASKKEIITEVEEVVEDGVAKEVQTEVEKARVSILSEVESKIDMSSDNILLEVNESITEVRTSVTKVDGKVDTKYNQLSTETTSKINVATNNIMLEVDKKVDGDSVISAINVSPENIQISSNQIDMTGNLDLNGTFKCYRDGENKSGDYLYQSGAVHRGYIQGAAHPTFSSGIWSPDGTNRMGYVSVGYTNSDNIDNYGCLYMSPEVNGGAHLYFSRLSGGTGYYSGTRYAMDGKVYYQSFLTGRTNAGVYSHVFDGGISSYAMYCNGLTATSIGCTGSGTFNGSITASGHSYINHNLRINNVLYSNDNNLWIGNNSTNPTYMVCMNSGGYFRPKGAVQLGDNNNPFYQLVSTYAPSVVSDARKKTDIKYVASSTQPMTLNLSDTSEYDDSVTIDDMYDHIKELPIVTYDLKENRGTPKRQVGFLAQDIMDSPAGRYIVDDRDEDNLSYDTGNRISVLEGALKKAIEKIEMLQAIIDEMNGVE